ncbi:MAG: hypothetical protein [Caudoviricetes sp.]|nr:MAG: hypothetical protein [Caudoviricetes sp.]
MKIVQTTFKELPIKNVTEIKRTVPFKISSGSELLLRSGEKYVLGLETGNVYCSNALSAGLQETEFFILFPGAVIHI